MASVVAPLDLEDIPSPSQPPDVLLPEIPHPFFAHVNQSPSLPFQTEFNYIAEFENLMMALYGTKKYTTLKNDTLEISLPQVPLHTIQPCPGFSKKVTKQRLYWKGIQELSRLYTDWTQNFSVIPLESSINCKGCFHEIGPIGNFCFFVKSLREVSFALQPELNREYLSNEKLKFGDSCDSNSKKADVGAMMYELLCPNCSFKIGNDTAHGPQKSRLFEFGFDKIFLKEFEEYYSLKWNVLNQLPEFRLVRRFDLENVLKMKAADTSSPHPILSPHHSRLILPSREEDFGWEDLLTNPEQLHPRTEQLKAFHRALLCNAIVMLPTGAGKTLIASLTLARFAKINPRLLAVMIVDRVPLVHQQAKCIRRDVFLRVFPLCGETTSAHIKSKILEGDYDCIVSTAGAFVEFLKYPGVSISNFSILVFDECHHAVKRHKYCEILQRVEASPHRPRLLGLSASPVTGKDYEQITSALVKMKENFLNAIFYKPSSVRKEPDYTWNHVRYSDEQKKKMIELQSELLQLCLKIQRSCDNQRDPDWFATAPLAAILSWAHELDPRPKANDLRHLGKINRDFEINKLLGPAYIDFPIDDLSLHSLDTTHLSPFLLKMEEIMQSLPDTSRILVFVDQKISAKMIQRRLLSTFPHMNPSLVVGNTGWDGMTWKEQDKILKNFNKRDGKESEHVRLIVSTSVLEEGLDVQGCDTVFRFGGRSSLIQFVQSRGRARTGKMYVILTDEDRLYIDNILGQEEMLNHAFRAESIQSDKQIEENFQRFNLQYPESDSFDLSGLAEDSYSLDDDSDGQPVALKFYGNCPHDDDIRPMVIRELKSLGCIPSISFVDFNFGEAAVDSGSPSLFETGDSIIKVNVAIDSSILEFFKYLISVWQFSVALTKTRFFDVYMPLPSTILTESAFPKSITQVDGIIKVEVGFLTGRRSYEIVHELGSESLAYKTLSITGNHHWKLEAMFKEQMPNDEAFGEEMLDKPILLEIQAPVSSLSEFAFVSADQNGRTFTLFIFVKYTPALLISEEEETTRISCPHEQQRISLEPRWAQEELHKISETPLFAITFPLSKWGHVLSMVSSSSFGLKVYFTKLIIEGQIGVSAQKRQAEFSLLSNRLWKNVSPKDLTFSERKIIFSLYSLSSFLHEMVLTPLSYHQIKMDIFKLLLSGIENKDLRESSPHQTYLTRLLEILENFPNFFQKKTLWTDCYEIFSLLKDQLESQPAELDLNPPKSEQEQGQGQQHEQEQQQGQEQGQEQQQEKEGADVINIDGYRSVSRILITPSRVIFRPAYLIKSNRLLRKFQSEEFAYISFVDEDTNPIFNPDVFKQRYKYFLINGICIGSISFAFLLCSASQQREQRAIFIAGDSTLAQSLRDQIAPFSLFKGDIAKYMSRLGLFCTADTFATTVSTDSVLEEPDIYTQSDHENGKMLTDGAGKISSKMLEVVRQKHHSRKPFCAFQFRYSGAKGVLYQIHDEERSLSSGCDVLLRDSNVKFKCADTDLCLVQPALFNPVKLNREMLNLLFSFAREGEHGGKWNPFPYIRKLQRAELLAMGEIFLDPQKALAVLEERLGNDHLTYITRIASSSSSSSSSADLFDLFEDHFVKKMLSVIYNYRCRMLRSKIHIPLARGAYLMGIPDPTGLLKDEQVFYQIQDPSRPHLIGSGRQLVYRNPCLDPGDVRVVTAVDIPTLHSYFNVLIFPASSDCLRSISAECSGGDLDGDMFSIISDPSLIPPGVFEAVDYDRIAKEAKASAKKQTTTPQLNPDDLNSLVAEFIIRAMTNSNLGRIARLHLALCDILPGQAAEPLARELAQTQSLAVDFVKTGVPPKLPVEAKKIVRKNGYPSFMENKTNSSYVSQKPLGILYDDVVSGVCELTMDRKLLDGNKSYIDGAIAPHDLFHLPGKEKYEAEALTLYKEYCDLIDGILSRFSLKHDAELVLGLPETLSPELMRDQGAVEQSLSEIWFCIKQKYRNIFRTGSGTSTGTEVGDAVASDSGTVSDYHAGDLLLKASAWHTVAYTTPPYCLSFSWLLSDYLKLIAEQNNRPISPTFAPPSVTDQETSTTPSSQINIIGESVLQYWRSIREELNEVVSEKLACFQFLQESIRTHSPIASAAYDLKLYGSVELLLCDEESDLDIFAKTTGKPTTAVAAAAGTAPVATEPLITTGSTGVEEELSSSSNTKLTQLFILRELIPLLDPIALSLTINETPAVPIIRGIFQTPTLENQVVDFSACADGLFKAAYIRSFYAQSSSHIVIMNCLMNWARSCRLIPVANDDEGDHESLRKGEFHAFVLSILYPTPVESHPSPAAALEPSPLTPSELILTDDLSGEDIGGKLIQFFREGQEVSYETDFVFDWPVPGSPIHTIKADMMKRVTIACSRAYHCLVRSRDWSFLQRNAIARDLAETKTVIQIPLNSILANHLLKASRWHIMDLENASKATVRITATDLFCEVEGRGTRLQIMNLRSVFRRFYQRSKQYLSGFVRSNCGAYFMANASLIYCREVYSILSKVTFECYLGPKHDQHSLGQLSRVVYKQKQQQQQEEQQTQQGENEEKREEEQKKEDQEQQEQGWREDYKRLIRNKFMEQLQELVLQSKEKVTVSIHFGTFYTVNAGDCFGSQDVTLSDLTQAHLRGREFKDRDYDESRLGSSSMVFNYLESKKGKDSAEQDGGGSGGGGGGEGDTSASCPPKLSSSRSISSSISCGSTSERSRKKNRLSTSFWNSIVNWRNRSVVSNDRDLSVSHDRLVSSLMSVFRGLGYSPRKGHEEMINREISSSTEWKATYILSPSYIAEVKYLNNDLSSPSIVSEKPLCWISATLLSGQSFLRSLPAASADIHSSSSSITSDPAHAPAPVTRGVSESASASESADILIDHDIRLKVCTVNELEPSNVMYRHIFPTPTPSPPAATGAVPLTGEREGEGEEDSRSTETVQQMIQDYPTKTLFALNDMGRPVPRDDKVNFVRRVKSRVIFDFNSVTINDSVDPSASQENHSSFSSSVPEVKVAAILSSIDHFLGENLSETVSGYDLALDVEVGPLVLWLENQLSETNLMRWVDKVVDHMFLVSDAVSRCSSASSTSS